jgi:hypothetical protein
MSEVSFFDIQDENYEGLIYLAQPYTHKHKEVRELRYQLGIRATKEFMMVGCTVLAPIVHYHPVATAYHMPVDYEFWKLHNLRMIQRCSAIRVLQIPGWRSSAGVLAETAAARGYQIPIEPVQLKQPIYESIDLAWT